MCKIGPPGVPFTSETALRETVWPNFLDANVMGLQCDVVGYPRLFTEHSSGSAASALSRNDPSLFF
jgi:hypothetical protein